MTNALSLVNNAKSGDWKCAQQSEMLPSIGYANFRERYLFTIKPFIFHFQAFDELGENKFTVRITYRHYLRDQLVTTDE